MTKSRKIEKFPLKYLNHPPFFFTDIENPDEARTVAQLLIGFFPTDAGYIYPRSMDTEEIRLSKLDKERHDALVYKVFEKYI